MSVNKSNLKQLEDFDVFFIELRDSLKSNSVTRITELLLRLELKLEECSGYQLKKQRIYLKFYKQQLNKRLSWLRIRADRRNKIKEQGRKRRREVSKIVNSGLLETLTSSLHKSMRQTNKANSQLATVRSEYIATLDTEASEYATKLKSLISQGMSFKDANAYLIKSTKVEVPTYMDAIRNQPKAVQTSVITTEQKDPSDMSIGDLIGESLDDLLIVRDARKI